MQLQGKLAQSLAQIAEKPLSVCAVLKAKGVSSAKRTTITSPRACRFRHCSTQRSSVMQKYRLASGAKRWTLRDSLFAYAIAPCLHHSGVHPFLDEPQDPRVRDPVLDELLQPSPVEGIVKPADVCIEHMVHLLHRQTRGQCIQRVVLTAPWPESMENPRKSSS